MMGRETRRREAADRAGADRENLARDTPRDATSREVTAKEMRSVIALRRRPSLMAVVGLVAMWCLLWGEVTWGNIIGGILVALAVTVILPMPRLPLDQMRFHLPSLARLAVTFHWEFLVSSLQVAWLSIRRSSQPPSAVLHVPMRVADDFTLAVAVTLLNLQPGGLVVNIDSERRMLTMHVLDGSSTDRIDAARAQFARMEQQLIDAFEGGR